VKQTPTVRSTPRRAPTTRLERLFTGQPVRGAQAVLRAIALLKRFDDRHRSWRLSALAQAEGLHRATAHRLLAALEQAGMLARDLRRVDHYCLGPEALALGARAQRASELADTARPELEILAASTGETVSLEVPVWPDMLIIDEALGPRLVGSRPSVGTRWPAHATSTGKAILATMAPEHVVRLLGRKPARPTAATLVDPAALARDLAETRRRGWAAAMDELEIGFAAVGAVIRARGGTVVGAISTGGPTERFDHPKRLASLGRQTRLAADRVAEALGWAALP
jgi:DNA-binding IclR family transcriptional regulator